MTTVSDILDARPSLKDRAAVAYRNREEQRAIERRQLEDEIAQNMREWLSEVCGCSESELHDLRFVYETITFGAKLQGTTMVDGVTFIGKHKIVTTTVASGMGDDAKVEDFVFYMSVKHENGCPEVKTLADVGEHASR